MAVTRYFGQVDVQKKIVKDTTLWHDYRASAINFGPTKIKVPSIHSDAWKFLIL